MFCFFVVVPVLMASTQQNEAQVLRPDVESLVASHERYQSRVRKMELEIEVERQIYKKGKAAGKPEKIAVMKWARDRDGDKERVRYQDFVNPPDKNGHTRSFADYFNEGKTTKFLANWDPLNPQKITPFITGSVIGQIRPRTKDSTDINPGLAILFTFRFDITENLSLSALIKESSKCELVEKTKVDGHEAWHLRAHRAKKIPDGRDGIEYIDIFLDAQHDFAVRKVIEQIGNRKGTNLLITREVKQFEKLENDIYIPTLIENELDFGGSDKLLHKERVVVRNVRINTPLPPDAFDFKFPEHCHVQNLPPVGKRIKVEIWGPDNRPAYTIWSRDDLKLIPGYDEFIKSQQSPSKRASIVWYCALVGVPLLLVAIIMVIRTRKRSLPCDSIEGNRASP